MRHPRLSLIHILFPSPLSVEKGIAELAAKHVLWADIGDSLRRVAIGFGLAVVIGIPFGLWLGWSPAANQTVNPVIQLLRPCLLYTSRCV